MTTTILAALGALILILHTATRIPAALTDLLRACLPLLHAINELRAALRPHPPQTKPQTDKAPSILTDQTNPCHDDHDQ